MARSSSCRALGRDGFLSTGLLIALARPVWPASAQAVYGSVAGTVIDASGASAPGARVTLTSLERSTSDTVLSGSSGYYRKERLLPGRYQAFELNPRKVEAVIIHKSLHSLGLSENRPGARPSRPR